ncbi:phage tail sheath subtilisin-like domain-containing protein [Synechococcus sp. PCC 7336]|uniref:phage tail sheath subtilisin-like domain-containing protein n=1 Tax=Synechococcus sp. PCC 7336 TaxID=195250 RepID=UPI000347F137|nr:phage tail sheath subtilisin-like domain-containing protein [Synechococcus sp. PCC 7336]
MPTYLSPGVYVQEVPPSARPIAGVGTSTAGFIGVVPDDVNMPFLPGSEADRFTVAPAGEPQLITSWEGFKNAFGDFQTSNATLAHAVYGFFNNGGNRCWILRVAAAADLTTPAEELEKFAAIDEIAIVAVPGATASVQHDAILSHCANDTLQDRFAILDGVQEPETLIPEEIALFGRSAAGSYGAVYYPWIEVFDPVDETIVAVPPSGHLAGIYARSDGNRGVFKAPANEVILGAVGVDRPISKADQNDLNPEGINAIRVLSGAIKVWGALPSAFLLLSIWLTRLSSQRL